MDAFTATPTYVEMVVNVSKRLGANTTFSYSDISLMWDECRYQQTYTLNKPSPWCAVSIRFF